MGTCQQACHCQKSEQNLTGTGGEEPQPPNGEPNTRHSLRNLQYSQGGAYYQQDTLMRSVHLGVGKENITPGQQQGVSARTLHASKKAQCSEDEQTNTGGVVCVPVTETKQQRRSVLSLNFNDYQSPQASRTQHMPGSGTVFVGNDLLLHANEIVREILQKLGPFDFECDQEDTSLLREPILEFENESFYQGEITDGLRHGRGRQVWSDGSLYEHGFGIETWADGTRYEGSYEQGKKHGSGKFQWSDGSQYEGEFCNNQIEGQGLYKWADSRSYDGQWLGNKMHGRGVFLFADGRRYEGEYVNDKKEGYGEFIWRDGRIYRGQWRNGKQHGQGVLLSSDGIGRKGVWLNGKQVEESY